MLSKIAKNGASACPTLISNSNIWTAGKCKNKSFLVTADVSVIGMYTMWILKKHDFSSEVGSSVDKIAGHVVLGQNDSYHRLSEADMKEMERSSSLKMRIQYAAYKANEELRAEMRTHLERLGQLHVHSVEPDQVAGH